VTQLLVVSGPPARSGFRLAKLRQQLSLNGGIYAEYFHLLELVQPLTPGELQRVEALLRYGPVTDLPQACGKLAAIVVPRLGTISPWSSKATEIFHICGLEHVVRVERGERWYMDPAEAPATIHQLFDRMTQRLVSDSDLESVFHTSDPRPLSRVPLMAISLAALPAIPWPSPLGIFLFP
jgi:phosphoribosylformylglycinamidine synthase